MKVARQLYLLRHALSPAARPGQSDYDRPLEEKGREDARALGRLLHERGTRFDAVIASGAARAVETWAGVAEAGFDMEMQTDDRLYHGKAEAYAGAFAASEGEAVVLVGHNPMIGDEAQRLAALAGRDARLALAGGMPKCSLAVFSIGGENGEEVRLVEFLKPPFAR